MTETRHTSDMVNVDELDGNRSREAVALHKTAGLAKSYLSSFSWCVNVLALYYNQGIPQAALFLAKIEATPPVKDDEVWIVAGDLPPLYLDCLEVPDGQVAFECYCLLAREWIDAVRSNQSVENMFPVTTADGRRGLPASVETADMLESRVRYIEDNLLADPVRVV